MKNIIVAMALLGFLLACNTNKGTSKTDQKGTSTAEMLVGQWQMLAIRFKDGRVMMGEFMGNPHYEFTTNGSRIKTLNTTPAPPPETTQYEVKGDSVFYPGTKYPAMKIIKIHPDTVKLENEKLSWHLARVAVE